MNRDTHFEEVPQDSSDMTFVGIKTSSGCLVRCFLCDAPRRGRGREILAPNVQHPRG